MGFLESLGRQTLSIFHQLGAVILLLMAAVREISAIRGRETCRQCLSLGVLSFPIVALTLLFTGMVLSVQIAGELTKYGADFTVGAIVAIGVGGGMMVASLSHGVSSYVFMHSIHVYCVPSDLYIGVFKSVIFGMIVALVGCDRGMTCTAGAEGVGKATTQSVVYSIIMLFAANYILSSILF